MALVYAVDACSSAIVLYDRLCATILQGLPAIPTRPWHSPLNVAISIAALIATWRFTTSPAAQSDDDSQRSMRMWLRFFAVSATIGALFLRTDAVVSMEVARAWAIVIDLLTAAEAWLFWSYVSRLSARIPAETLVRQSHAVRWGEVLGILAGPTLNWVIYPNTGLSNGFRLFGPLPGRLILLVYRVIAPFVLLSFAARVRALGRGAAHS